MSKLIFSEDQNQFVQRFKGDIPVAFQDINGNPVDITGKTVEFVLRLQEDKSSNNDDIILKKIITNHTDPVNGLTSIPIDEGDFDIELKDYISNLTLLDAGSDERSPSFQFIWTITRNPNQVDA